MWTWRSNTCQLVPTRTLRTTTACSQFRAFRTIVAFSHLRNTHCQTEQRVRTFYKVPQGKSYGSHFWNFILDLSTVNLQMTAVPVAPAILPQCSHLGVVALEVSEAVVVAEAVQLLGLLATLQTAMRLTFRFGKGLMVSSFLRSRTFPQIHHIIYMTHVNIIYTPRTIISLI